MYVPAIFRYVPYPQYLPRLSEICYTNEMPTIDIQKLQTLQGEELLTTLEQEAIQNGISDIHFSPEKTVVRVEWRELGILRKLLEISRETFETMKRRIKFNARLKMNVENIAQDGQYTFPAAGRMINVRVAQRFDPFGSDGVKAAVRDVERSLGARGRVVLRPSGTEPLIRVMVEGEDAGVVRGHAERIAQAVAAAAPSA